MNKVLYHFFTEDHRRIEKILDQATQDINSIDMDLYNDFRIGLLTHIKMEEKILFPAAQKSNGGIPIPNAAQLRLDHGALTTLVVPPPTESLLKVMRTILEIHDEVEEKEGGVYDICESLTKEDTQEILSQLKAVTPTPVHPVNPKPYALEAAIRAVERAGYRYHEMAKGSD